MVLNTITDHEIAPTGYVDRPTVKAVVVGSDGKILMYPSTLLGGGVDEGESYEDALHRELLEEAGVQVEIVKSLGEVICYRDHSKKKYLIQGYLCNYIGEASAPTTTQADEVEVKAIWEDPHEAIARLQTEITKLEGEDPANYPDTYQAKIQNRQMTVAFLQEAFDK